jgi:NAD-reducing hydrogenase small subunit
MSLLNLHQGLLEIMGSCDLVYSPLIDIKEYPHGADIELVEGAVASEENRVLARIIRQRTKVVISLGDCAVNGNVAALRNPLELEAVVRCSYGTLSASTSVSRLLPQVLPLHQVIRVDAFIPGCPPDPALIKQKILAHSKVT